MVTLMRATAMAILCNAAPTLSADEPTPPSTSVHPGISHSRGGIDFVKAKLAADQQLWKDAWAQLTASRVASLEWSPNPRPHVERGAHNRPNIGSGARGCM